MNITQENELRPFAMLDHVYFVGGRDVSCHVIDTGEGLIMIDSGYPHMRQMIIDNMHAVGLDPKDLKIILHSHGHYDHIGNTIYFKEISGAKTFITSIDNEITNGHLPLSWAEELEMPPLEPFDCDVLLEDGDIVMLGNTEIKCVAAPGHTAGTIAMFFKTEHQGETYTCAMHGGIGTNSMEKAFLEKYGLSLECREAFREGLHQLAKYDVDVVLGNHPDQNDTEGKYTHMKAGDANACIDPTEWKRFLKNSEARLDRMLEEESKK